MTLFCEWDFVWSYNGLLNFQDWSYLVHCTGWPLSASSWEPEHNLTREVIETYDHPTGITKERLDFGRETLLLSLQHYLRGQAAQNHPFEAHINFDVFRKLFETSTATASAVRGYKAYQRSDFDGTDLPVWWDRIVNKDRYCRCFVYPLLMRQILSWSPVNYTLDDHGELQELPRTPVEKVLERCTTDACRIWTIPWIDTSRVIMKWD